MKNPSSRAGQGPDRDSDKEAFWRKTLKEQASGGLNIRVFCRTRGLSEPSFYAWRRSIAERDGNNASRPAPSHRPGFVELCPPSAVVRTVDVPLEIVVGDRRLLIRPGSDLMLLRQVLAALASTGSAGSGE